MLQNTGTIVQELMDESHIEGHRVSVRRIHALIKERGLTPEEVADKLNLDIADVYRALAYYHDHPRKMHQVEQKHKKRVQDSLKQSGIAVPEDL